MSDTIANDQTLLLLAHLRIKADLELLPKLPYFFGKPYPLGRCCEIRDAVFEQLKLNIQDNSDKDADTLRRYLAKGHSIEKIWGSLRGQYFQNAIKAGDFYIDCANDTVNPSKPRIEIMPMAESGFKLITDFEEFAKIAESYWEVSVYQNTVCSSIAPFFPLLFLDKKNNSWITSNNHMIKVAQESAFEKSERILEKLPIISEQHQAKWAARLATLTNEHILRNDLTPTEFCQAYREKSLHRDEAFRDKIVTAYSKINKPI